MGVAPKLSLDDLKKLRPCSDRLDFIRPKLSARPLTAAQAVKAGATLGDLVWVASAVARKDTDIERRLRMWMTDCAARVLHFYEKEQGATDAPRKAILAARAFANGEITAEELDAARATARAPAWAAARAAAWATARAPAWAAARAAAWAAARAPAWAAARAPAWAAARAAAWAAARAPAWAAARDAARAAAWAAEEQWQLERLVAWLSAKEPEPLALPAISKAKGMRDVHGR